MKQILIDVCQGIAHFFYLMAFVFAIPTIILGCMGDVFGIIADKITD